MLHGRDVFDTVIERLSSGEAAEFSEPGATVERLRRIEGPFSSVLQVRIQPPARPGRDVRPIPIGAYIKIMKPRGRAPEDVARTDRMLRREYLATQALHEAVGDHPGLGAVRPLAFLPDLRAIVTAEVPGQPLGELLANARESSQAILDIVGNVGAWIRLYQGLGTSSGTIELSERRRYLDDRLALIEGRVLKPAERRAVLDEFDALASEIGLDAVPAVPIHADLTPLNVIVDDRGRVTVLDFTMAKSGTVCHDLAHVHFHLQLHAMRHGADRQVVDAMQRSLLRGYSPTASAEDPLFRMMLLQHAVCHIAFLAERRLPIVDLAYRWFMRRRWTACRRAPGRVEARRPAVLLPRT